MNIPEWLGTFSYQHLIMVQINTNHQLVFLTATCCIVFSTCKKLRSKITLGRKSSGTWINQYKTKKFCQCSAFHNFKWSFPSLN